MDEYVPQEGDKIEVSIEGLRTPMTSAPTDSFSIATYNYVDGTFYFYIDKVESGLIISNKCNYPCKDCPDGEPDTCLSCY